MQDLFWGEAIGRKNHARIRVFFLFSPKSKINSRVFPVISSMDRENPHDRFAKIVMSKIENAKDFFQGVLPEGTKRLIDLETLQQDPESYVDEELSEFISDIVFTCRCRESLR